MSMEIGFQRDCLQRFILPLTSLKGMPLLLACCCSCFGRYGYSLLQLFNLKLMHLYYDDRYICASGENKSVLSLFEDYLKTWVCYGLPCILHFRLTLLQFDAYCLCGQVWIKGLF